MIERDEPNVVLPPMLLIATDEAGYGPKLGPLVVAASMWRIPDDLPTEQDLLARFAPLRKSIAIADTQVVIDDSKAIFQPSRDNPLAGLHAAVSICNHWCGLQANDFSSLLSLIAGSDRESIDQAPWLQDFSGAEFLSKADTEHARSAWSSTELACQQVRCRVITAKRFNAACSKGYNKADLLSESTLGLVHQLVQESIGQNEPVAIYCDRHGGRRYYAGVLQHIFADATVSVSAESKQQSAYRIARGDYDATIRFTVKGDSFTPVAMSSIYAKYMRERLMQSFNKYFATHHHGDRPLKPTAGYPTDADRFLEAIEPIMHRNKISTDDLVRQR